VKKQMLVEQGLSGIDAKVEALLNNLDEKTKDLINNISGGDSFCHAEPFFIGKDHFVWIFFHTGKYPLYDVSVRIYNCRKNPLEGSAVLKLGTLFPDRAQMFSELPGGSEEVTPIQGFNLFFVARNGSWVQEIRWTPSTEGNAIVTRVLRDGGTMKEPLLLRISPSYSGETPNDQSWGDPPGLEKLY